MTRYSTRIDKKYGAGSSPLKHQPGKKSAYGSTVFARTPSPTPKAPASSTKPTKKTASKPVSRGPTSRPNNRPSSKPSPKGPTSRPNNRPSSKPMTTAPTMRAPLATGKSGVTVGEGSSKRLGDRPLRANRRAAQSKARLPKMETTDTIPFSKKPKLKDILKGFPNRQKKY